MENTTTNNLYPKRYMSIKELVPYGFTEHQLKQFLKIRKKAWLPQETGHCVFTPCRGLMESMRRHHVFLFLHKVSFFMTKSLYVGNLPWSATEDDVRDLFAPYGEVTSVKLVSDRETGRARGFGFVEMASEGVQAAVEALDNFSFSGRNLKVNEARPREARPSYSRY